MLDTAITHTRQADHNDAPATGRHQILKMKPHDRMGGSVPVWETQKSARDDLVEKLAYATAQTESFDTALAYAARQTNAGPREKPFGFGDLIDMVNPLQHVPVVGSLYRNITGDEIRPVSRVVGSSLYGGPAGAAGSLVNVMVEQETGRDITGNVLAFIHKPGDGNFPVPGAENVTEDAPVEELPGTVVRYTDLGLGKRRVHKQMPDNDRMAGTVTHIYTEIVTTPRREREPVMEVVLDPLPPAREREITNTVIPAKAGIHLSARANG